MYHSRKTGFGKFLHDILRMTFFWNPIYTVIIALGIEFFGHIFHWDMPMFWELVRRIYLLIWVLEFLVALYTDFDLLVFLDKPTLPYRS